MFLSIYFLRAWERPSCSWWITNHPQTVGKQRFTPKLEQHRETGKPYTPDWLSRSGTAMRTWNLSITNTPTDCGDWFNIKMLSYQCRKSHCGDKTIIRLSYLHKGITYMGKMASWYWIRLHTSQLIFKLVWCSHYNMVDFLQNPHRIHLTAHLLGWEWGVVLWVQTLIDILPQSLQWSM